MKALAEISPCKVHAMPAWKTITEVVMFFGDTLVPSPWKTSNRKLGKRIDQVQPITVDPKRDHSGTDEKLSKFLPSQLHWTDGN